MLEIGACYGKNLKYLSDEFGMKAYGIEPSFEAVSYGKEKYNSKIVLSQGTSDDLPYENEKFNIVVLGFCLFWVDRKYLMKTVSEADRVLKENGYLVIVDFDTKIPFKRSNIHNPDAWTYKMQYSNLFLANPQYFLVKKINYSHTELFFCEDIQERICFDILYKENEDNVYIRG